MATHERRSLDESARDAWICPDGYLRTNTPGRCPEHGSELQRAAYRCPQCEFATLEGGSCPVCRVSVARAA